MANFVSVFTQSGPTAEKSITAFHIGFLNNAVHALLVILAMSPPVYEKPVGDMTGAYSQRINIQYRLAYQVIEVEKTVKVLRMWSYYA